MTFIAGPRFDLGTGGHRSGRAATAWSAVMLLAILGSYWAASFGHVRTTVSFLGLAVLGLVGAFVARGSDTTSYLVVVAVVVILIPPSLGVGGRGLSPASLLALGAGWLWIYGSLVPSLGLPTSPQPLHWAFLAYAMATGASLVVSAVRPLDALEAGSSNLGILAIVTSLSAALLICDGVSSWARLYTFLRALVVAGSVAAVVGIVQFTLEYDLSALIGFPGLTTVEGTAGGIHDRDGFARVIGTMLHPIEFSVVLTVLLPIALHLTYQAAPGRRGRWWLSVALLASAIPMSVSRSGAVGLFFVAIILFPTWTGPRRVQAMIAATVFAVGMKVLVPGLLGTIRGLFLSAGVDPSVTARTVDYGFVTDFISERPWFGRGNSTFLPERYDFLDNQYLVTLVETGIIGLLTIVGMFFVGICLCRRVKRATCDPVTADLAQSLVASLVVVLASFATFDYLGFQTARLSAFIVLGCTGAVWRLHRADEAEARSPDAMPAGRSTSNGSGVREPRQL
ncbi:MAG: O-antigen ligase family protein [Acidimicrobiales bacterium]